MSNTVRITHTGCGNDKRFNLSNNRFIYDIYRVMLEVALA